MGNAVLIVLHLVHIFILPGEGEGEGEGEGDGEGEGGGEGGGDGGGASL